MSLHNYLYFHQLKSGIRVVVRPLRHYAQERGPSSIPKKVEESSSNRFSPVGIWSCLVIADGWMTSSYSLLLAQNRSIVNPYLYVTH